MTRRKKADSSAGLVALLMFMVMVAVLVLSALAALARNPVLPLLMLTGGGLVFWRVSVRRQRNRELADARRRQAEIYAAMPWRSSGITR